MKLKIRLSNNKIIAGALMSIALINSGCNDFLNKVQPQGQESSITFMQTQDNVVPLLGCIICLHSAAAVVRMAIGWTIILTVTLAA